MTSFEQGIGVQTLQILGWALLHSLWIGALVGVVFGALRIVVRDRIGARYWLGVGCLFAFASIEIALFVNALISALVLSPEVQVAAHTSLTLASLESSAAPNLAAHSSAAPLTMLIAFAWLFGVAVSIWRLMRSHRTLQLLALHAQTDAYSELRRLCAPLLELLHLRTNVRFAVSELIDVPCVIGLFKPVLLLPAALLARMPQDQLELVLLHELSHIKNGDLWINSAQILVEVLMFFHPVVHWISADVRATRERRCDRAVLSVRAAPVRYAHALVSLEEFRHEFRGLALAATGGELSARVRDILASRARGVTINSRRSMRGTVLLSLTAAVVLVGAVSSAIVRRTVATPAASQAAVLPNNVAVAKVPSTRFAAPVTLLATKQPTIPVAADSLSQAVFPALESAPIPPVVARKVLSAPRNLLALQTLPKHVFERIPAPELASVDAAAIAVSVAQPPKVITRVQPVFALGVQRRQVFTLSFGLDAAGIPQQIRLARGQASKKQLLAAQTALAQWRFEPEASAKFTGNRLEQSFSFREVTSVRCIPNVGTRICR